MKLLFENTIKDDEQRPAVYNLTQKKHSYVLERIMKLCMNLISPQFSYIKNYKFTILSIILYYISTLY